MATSVIQTSFAAGELSPSMYARVDTAKYHVGAAVMRNFYVDYRGGAASRQGSRFVGSSKSPYAANPSGLLPVRLLPFQFSTTQTYTLEFGNFYMRIINNGGYVLESTETLAIITNANPAVLTVFGHGFSNGDWIIVNGVQGLTRLNGKTFIVQNATTDTFTLTDLFGNIVNTISDPTPTAPGTVARIYTVVSPYAAADLKLLKKDQSADTMTFTHPNYNIYNLKRFGNTNWVFSQVTYASSQTAPTATNATPTVTTPTPLSVYGYQVTAVNAAGEESVASNIVTCNSVDIAQTAGSIAIAWASTPGAVSYNIYRAPVGYGSSFISLGALFGLVGSANGLQFIDGNVTPDYTKTPPVHRNPFANGAITSINFVGNGNGNYSANTTVTVSDPTGTGAIVQPIVLGGFVQGYVLLNGGQNYTNPTLVYSNVGSGAGAAATVSVGPLTGNAPGCSSYYQQRQYFANALNLPVTFWATRPGAYTNMDVSSVSQPDDAITDTLSAQQVNGIQFMIPMTGGLVILTGLGAWQLTGGGNSTAVTPQSADATPQAYNGCSSTVPPIPINYDILYVQAKGSIVRDLAYNFFVNIYTGNDLTVISNHLFIGHTINEWAWAEEPYKIVWCVRDDGIMLSLTFLKEQDVIAWARHDTYGYYESVSVVSEPPVNATYVVVRRFIQNVWVQYIERFDNRIWQMVEDTWAVDCGLQSPSNTPNAGLRAAAATGDTVTFTADAAVFNSGMVGNVIRMGSGIATVVSYIDPQNVTAKITTPITNTIPNDFVKPARPFPAAPGAWSINPPLTVVSGLDHLNGATVSILADGSVQTPQTVVNGTVTLQGGPTLATIGLGFVAQLASLALDTGNPTIQGKRKNIPQVTVRVQDTRGFKVGPSFDRLTEIKERGNSVFAGQPIPLYTGDQLINLNPSWNKTGQVFLQQDYPLPATVLGFIPQVEVGDSE